MKSNKFSQLKNKVWKQTNLFSENMERFKFNLWKENLQAMFRVENTIFMQIIMMFPKNEISHLSTKHGELEYQPECLSIAQYISKWDFRV